MSGIFQKLIEIGITLGTITDAHLYGGDFITIEGIAHEGKKFTLSMNIKEANEND